MFLQASVCDSVKRRGVWSWAVSGQRDGVCSGGGSALGVAWSGGCLVEPPGDGHYCGRYYILLECILVLEYDFILRLSLHLGLPDLIE